MKCNLVLSPNNRGWIIEKMCHRLGEELTGLGCEVSIGDAARQNVNINHFMMFTLIPGSLPARSTVAITHIDDSKRLEHARRAVETAELVICMSSMTVKQLVNDGLSRAKMCYVLPALDDGMRPRRIVIGLTTKLYSDGRKRESLLVRLAKEMDLSGFHFDIFGTGWDEVASILRQAGAFVTVTVDGKNAQEDYRRIRERIPHFDYYLYLGLDEGSMGTLDALAAGVKTIVTPQGFHVDLPHGITHPFWEYTELRAVFESILAERNARLRAVKDLSWRAYAEKHLLIWKAVLEDRTKELPRLLDQESLDPLGGYAEGMEAYMAGERRRLRLRTLMRHRFPQARSFITRRLKRWLPVAVTARLTRRSFGKNV